MSSRPSRHDIHAELRERIILLDLPPGTRLREEELAERFGVSRTPIRQVLDRLEFEGLVEQGDGRGARVSTLDPKELRDIWAMRLRIAALDEEGNEILGCGGFGFRYENQDLRDEFNRVLNEMQETGEVQDIVEEHLGIRDLAEQAVDLTLEDLIGE